MGKTFKSGVCLLAIAALLATDAAAARRKSLCADGTDVSALQTAAVQQALMDSALGCGQEWLQKFNTFQTSFGPELRRSDRALLTFFKRIYGPRKGDAEYNLFKTNMASKAEIKRVRNITDFCASANLVFAAALADAKPALTEFVAGVQIVEDETPIGKCEVQVALTLKGAMAAPDIMPTPNPLRLAVVEPPLPTPASLTMGPLPHRSDATADAAAPAQPEQAAQPAPQPEEKKEEKKGFLSGLFGH